MKKIYKFLIFLFVILNTGCSVTKEKNETEDSIQTIVEEKSDENNDYIKDQINTLLVYSDIWELSDETIGDFCEKEDCNGFGYAVTDLDEDGYIEIIKSLYIGNGHFSWNSFYEVTEEGDVIRWDDSELKECYSQPDLLSMDLLPFFSNAFGETIYYVDDFESLGVYGWIERYGFLELYDDTVSYKEEGRYETYENNVTYFIGEEEVTEKEYSEEKTKTTECESVKKLTWFTEITYDSLMGSYLGY